MIAYKRDAVQGQDPDCLPEPSDLQSIASCSGELNNPAGIARPLKAIRQYCLWCCNGSALEVSRCPAVSCPFWPYRFGRKPTADMTTGGGDRRVYPLESPKTVADFDKNGGTPLKAIKRLCLDCSGHCKSAVRNCQHAACELYPYRDGKNPHRRMAPEQREKAAARLKANVKHERTSNLS